MPVIRTRRPGSRAPRACAGGLRGRRPRFLFAAGLLLRGGLRPPASRSSIASSRRPMRAQLALQLADVVVGRRPAWCRSPRARARAPCSAPPRRRDGRRRARPARARASAARRPSVACIGALHRLAQASGSSLGCGSSLRHVRDRESSISSACTRCADHDPPEPRHRSGRARAAAGRSPARARGGPGAAGPAEDVQPPPRAVGLHRHGAATASRSRSSRPAWAGRARRSSCEELIELGAPPARPDRHLRRAARRPRARATCWRSTAALARRRREPRARAPATRVAAGPRLAGGCVDGGRARPRPW